MMANIVASAVDYSWGRPSPQDIRNKGYTIVIRYVGNPATDGRCISPAERDGLYNAGLRLATVAQYGAVDDPRGGYDRGAARGRQASAGLDLIGWPKSKPVIVAVGDVGDPDGGGPRPGFPQASDVQNIKDFFRGFKDNCPWPCGVYGPYWLLEALSKDLIAVGIFCYWQTAGGSGNGEGTGGSAYNPGDGTWRRLSIHACMYQQYGGETVPATDHNQVYGHHDTNEFTYHPNDGSTSPIPPKDEDMAITHIWTSTKANRDWLTEVAGFVDGVPSGAPPIEGGWEHPWAGLAAWECEEGVGDIRMLTGENHDLLNAVRYIQAVNHLPVTIVDDGAMESKWFRAKTLKPMKKFQEA
jgi:hypothetical protein